MFKVNIFFMKTNADIYISCTKKFNVRSIYNCLRFTLNTDACCTRIIYLHYRSV